MSEVATQPATPQPAVAQTPAPTPAPVSVPVPTPDKVDTAPQAKGDAVGDRILKERDEALAKLAEIQQASEQAERDKAVQNKDVETLQQKHLGDLQARDQQIKLLQQSIANAQRDAAVNEIVNEMFLDKHKLAGDAIVSKRVGATVNEKGEPELIIYDERGKRTKADVEAFKKELSANDQLSDYLKGADLGSGSADVKNPAPLPTPTGVSQPGQQMLDPLQKFKAMQHYRNASPAQLVEMAKARKGRR